ncbi:MAG TPA: carboxymuconolactone decarboxylase family protein [Burkholderiales bacterium]|nr:carboxymuconolactone decarboxylase family protein [Burkholderiales bacterium]
MRKSITQDALFKKGVRVRKAVLGAESIQKRLANANVYTEAFEEFTTKAAWGLVWSRPGLSRRIRSFINLGMLIALGQPEELRLHVRAALRNGVTRMEISEAILHSAVYCGVPRATAARRIMLAVFGELDAAPNSQAKLRR